MSKEEIKNIISYIDKPLIAVFLAIIFTLLIIIVIQTKEIKREKCKIGCEKYRKEDETGLFIQLENSVWWFKKNWSLFVIYTASSSLIFLLLLTLIFPQKDTLVIMNNWVSLILGFVALFMSVTSMFLSFYNVEQSHNNDLRTEKTNKEIEDKLRQIDELKLLLDISTRKIENALNNTHKEIKDLRDEVKNGATFRAENYSNDRTFETPQFSDKDKIKKSGIKSSFSVVSDDTDKEI